MERIFPRGTWPVMLTPFNKKGAVDYAGLKALTKWYIDQGCSGLFANCQSSEMFFLNLPERIGIASTVIEMAKGKVPVVVSGHISDDKHLQIEELLQIAALDPSAIVFVTNRFAKEDESDEVWKANCLEVMNSLPKHIPLGLYECEYPYKRLLSPELLKWCAASGRFYFLQDNSCDLNIIKERLEIVANTNLQIYNSNSATLLPSLKAGSSGFCGAMSSFQPKLYAWLCQHTEDDRAEKLQDFLTLSSCIENCNYPVNSKYYLKEFENLDINSSSRLLDEALLTESNKEELRALRAHTMEMRKRFKL